MQKYNTLEVAEQFRNAIALSERILETFYKKDAKLWGEVAELYNKRAETLSYIESWRMQHTDTLQGGEQAEEWIFYAQKLEKLDKQVFQHLTNARDDVQKRLQELMKRQYLLIYSKEPKS